MSMSAREVIADQIIGPSPGYQIGGDDSEGIIEALDAAGFVIVPKEPTAAMVDAAALLTTTFHGRKAIYRAMITAATQEPKP